MDEEALFFSKDASNRQRGMGLLQQKLGPILQQGSCVDIAVGEQDDEEEEEAHFRCARHRHRLTGNSH